MNKFTSESGTSLYCESCAECDSAIEAGQTYHFDGRDTYKNMFFCHPSCVKLYYVQIVMAPLFNKRRLKKGEREQMRDYLYEVLLNE